jgi:hypothetical protein
MRLTAQILALAAAALLSGCPPTRPVAAPGPAIADAPDRVGDPLWLALAGWAGRSPQQLRAEQEASGLRDADTFAVVLVVSLNLGVNLRELSTLMRGQSLSEALRSKGFSATTVRREVRRAEQQVRDWRRQPRTGA